ncbi:uncharacterized protein F4812DRAFT_455685 [Daldinia caldariorum]|uniref:uncharacterized protein n=1 Tax=Daldinia caldariorum TaxID=326644 RepID=UPI002008234B|nr:uncharacterized protein F4812DRAFT_455685 [Daldinia caldariorum]KAI1471578.1 hypothetical protein F4812DRAFT_455685 [Daldinia caldariorum]
MSSAETTQGGSSQDTPYHEKLKNIGEITPLSAPLISWGGQRGRSPREYLENYKTSYELPYGYKVATWRQIFFCDGEWKLPSFRTQPEIKPLRPDAPTIVLLFYPRPDEQDARPVHRSESYLRRIERIANMGEQTIIYVPPELKAAVKAMRDDPHWYVINEYPTIWDMPNNAYQKDNFATRQPALFAQFDGYTEADGDLRPEPRYNRAHHSAVCNAKAFIMYDAIMRNPFGTDYWMYVDAGFLFDDGPKDEEGTPWGELFRAGLDTGKFERAVSVARDAGVVMGEYSHRHGCPDAEDECFVNPRRSWRARQFIAQVYVGNSLGMLNYSVRFMQTVDDMDANGFYTGREELVVPFVALRYPNSVFSVPYFRLPPRLDYPWQFPMKFVFSAVGGPESVPPIVDPIATLYCKGKGYIPRRPNLRAGGIYEGAEENKEEQESDATRRIRSPSMTLRTDSLAL